MAKPTLDLTTLTVGEKLELIDDIWQSLGPEELELSAEQQEDLDRRLERLDREGPTGVPWAAVRAEMSRGIRD
jgi:putative addiction module component (TIGR02574 family)